MSKGSKNRNCQTLRLIKQLKFLNSWGCKDKDTTPNNSGESDTAFIATVTFPSLDSVVITADHYHTNNSNPVVVLCHQAGWSRGEYLDVAPIFNDMGYNVVAIDQCSGGVVNGIENKTKNSAVTQGKSYEFIDAKQDIMAAVDWGKSKYNKNVILLGSSYSASLVLMVASERHDIEC